MAPMVDLGACAAYAADVLQQLGFALAVAIVCTFTLVVVMSRRHRYAPILRTTVVTIWLFALLRLYSASSFLWAHRLDEAGLLWTGRSVVFVLESLIMVSGVALVIWFRRH